MVTENLDIKMPATRPLEEGDPPTELRKKKANNKNRWRFFSKLKINNRTGKVTIPERTEKPWEDDMFVDETIRPPPYNDQTSYKKKSSSCVTG